MKVNKHQIEEEKEGGGGILLLINITRAAGVPNGKGNAPADGRAPVDCCHSRATYISHSLFFLLNPTYYHTTTCCTDTELATTTLGGFLRDD